MKKIILTTALLFNGLLMIHAQTDANNGDWKKRDLILTNTSECDFMIRQGDIDNLGFGWEKNFNPFSGKSTPGHMFPWEKDTLETIMGYDMILLPSSMGTKEAPCSGDGYSGQLDMMKEKYGQTVWEYKISMQNIDTSKIKKITLQLFVDDFQAPEFCSRFTATLNGKSFPTLSKTINSLRQTGPIGKLITVKVPDSLLKEFKKPEIKLLIDDKTTAAADGFAIDFIKIMINPKVLLKGDVSGMVYNQATGRPVPNANLEINGIKVKSDAKGMYKFTGITAGLAVIEVNAAGFPENNFTVDVEENKMSKQDLFLSKEVKK